MLELRDVKKSYHSKLILKQASLKLEKEIYWVKGPNGSGKTTLLKMIAGLLPFDGDIILEETSQKQKPVLYRQMIGWSEAEPLYPDFITGRDMLHFYGNIFQVEKSELRRLLEMFELTGYIDSKIGTYSAGMIKKLSLVLAFLGNRRLCILDEPFITLDTTAFEMICAYIKERHLSEETIFLISSHQEMIPQLATCCKQIIIDNQSITF